MALTFYHHYLFYLIQGTLKKKQELPYFEGPDSKGGPQQTQQTAPVSPIGALRADIQVQTLTGIPFTKTEVSDALLKGEDK